ncbi:MAG: M48 family metallopeptidase [Paramuribaculum sp.]|nr:M48 family metallopeptidase [Paramuribaculum sp.]
MTSAKGYMDHALLGRVQVTVNRRARRYTARWKGTQLNLTAPPMCTTREIREVLDHLAPRLLASRPGPLRFIPGHHIGFDGFTLYVESLREPGKIGFRYIRDSAGDFHPVLGLSADVDTARPEIQRQLASYMPRIARPIAIRILLPLAESISGRLGANPARWEIGRGAHRLGTCGSDRVISLSSMCIYLPQRLREYIICHELAHLTHFDHSAAFHELCSRYCGGDGDARRAELKAYSWPVPRP